MTPVLYLTLTVAPYVVPIDPIILPTIPNWSWTGIREQIIRQHKEDRRIYDTTTNMDDALKGQIIDTIKDTHLCELRNKYTGYLGVATRDLLHHLIDRYGKITTADVEANKSRMNEPIDITHTIDVFFKSELMIASSMPMMARLLSRQSRFCKLHIMQCAPPFITTTHANVGHKKPAVANTWALFKSYFAEEFHALKEQQCVNTLQANFHGVNSVLDISSALDNLTMAVTTNRDIVPQLTQNNKQLVERNTTLTSQLKSIIETNNNLIKKLGSNSDIATKTSALKKVSYTTNAPAPKSERYDPQAPFVHVKRVASLDPNRYCWSHGFRVQVGHNSKDCKGKLGGHQDYATRRIDQRQE